ncbi:hypothetical protein OG21DRAFT_1425515, partial [Imleria badia]
VNYTMYDLCHDQDTLNPRTHANVLVLAHEEESKYPHLYCVDHWHFSCECALLGKD